MAKEKDDAWKVFEKRKKEGTTWLDITNSKDLYNMEPTEADRQKYDVVICRCLPVFEPRRVYEELLAKICFLAKETVILDILVEDSQPDEHSWGKKGRMINKNTPHQATVATTLRIVRRFNDFCFVITDELRSKGLRRVYTAKRMPEVKWDGEKLLWDYPEHTVVEVPLTFKDWRGFFARIDQEKEKWVKHERVEQLIKEFKIYLFVPIYFCKETKHVRQGAHRLEVARRRGDKTIKVRIMKVWWKKFESGKWVEDPDVTHWKGGKPFVWLEDHKPDEGKVKGEELDEDKGL